MNARNSLNAMETLDAWRTAQGNAQILREDGLPREVHDGSALCQYQWEAGELTGIREADGGSSHFTYGRDGRLLGVRKSCGESAEYQYDARGWLNRITRGNVTFHYEHDAQGRLLGALRGNAGPWHFRWQDNRVVRARSQKESCDFQYDIHGRLTGLQQTVEDRKLSLQFYFDAAQRLEKLEFAEWGYCIEYAWDARGRPASVSWNGRPLAHFGYDDQTRSSWSQMANGLREATAHEAASGQAMARTLAQVTREIWAFSLERDAALRVCREGERHYDYDAQGRLVAAVEGDRRWDYSFDLMDQPILPADLEVRRDHAGRVCYVRRGQREQVFRHNDGDEMLEALHDGQAVARCTYDHKGRLVVKQTADLYERYVYGADDALVAIADREGQPRIIFINQPCGPVALVDFRRSPAGRIVWLHCDPNGTLRFISDEQGDLEGPFDCDPFGLPLQQPAGLPYLYRGRIWHRELGLYRLGCRWYDPTLRQFLSADSYTGAPDDERLVNPFINARDQRRARQQILCDWLKQPRWRNVFVYCANDPINRFDPNGHWSFGGVLLSLLGVIWTLPNTIFGLAVEITCLLGEVIRWLVYAVSWGNASWQTPGFDVAASGHLNAFALVFKGGWLGSFESLLGITFGNVFFVNGEYQDHPAYKALPDPVSPPAYKGTVTIPKSQVLYEHELRHVNQYGWWGPFFHLGLPIWGAYVWDVILNGYHNASMEKDARDHGGF
jgi:RHS repeat-associated protein